MKKLPLSGVRVLDLSRVVAAPTCAQVLGDLGADVIKVERPGTGDEGRYYGVYAINGPDGKTSARDGSMYVSANRNKRGITVDIASAAGQDLVRRLAAKSDVFIENFKTGDLARYGLDKAAVEVVNPRIVYCSVTGFGQTGPDRFKPGYDPVFQARGGWMSVNGESDDAPIIVAANMIDTITGYFAAMSVLAALYHRDRADDPAQKGQAIDIALLDVALASINLRAQDYLLTGEQPARRKKQGTVFPCADGNVVVAAGNAAKWKAFCKVLGHPEWGEDPRYSSHAGRVKNNDEIYGMVNAVTRTRSMAELAEQLEKADVPHAAVMGFAQAFDDPQARARGMRQSARHASGQDIGLIANPMRFSGTPITEYAAPPWLGQHTDEVLDEVLGLDQIAIDALRRDKTI